MCMRDPASQAWVNFERRSFRWPALPTPFYAVIANIRPLIVPAPRQLLMITSSYLRRLSQHATIRNATRLCRPAFPWNHDRILPTARTFSDIAPSESPTPEIFKRAIYFDHSIKLKTLKPERLLSTGQEIINLSGRQYMSAEGANIYYLKRPRKICKFPDGTRGFLYYCPGSTDIAGQLRFRICDDAATFDKGYDLLFEGKYLWAIDLARLVKAKMYRRIVNLVVEEGFATRDLVGRLAEFVKTFPINWFRSPLYTLSDPFYLDISVKRFLVYLFSLGHFSDYSIPFPPKPVQYGGILKVRFELSTFEEHATYGPTLVLKILEVVQPIHSLVPNPEPHTILAVPGGYFHTKYRRQLSMWCFPLKQYNRMNVFGKFLDMPGVIYSQ